MPDFGLKPILEVFTTLGTTGLILVLWYISSKDYSRLLAAYQTDTKAVLKKYEEDMREMRFFYESNVKLVERFTEISQDLKDIVLLNTSKWQGVHDAVQSNQYCPLSELRRKMKGEGA